MEEIQIGKLYRLKTDQCVAVIPIYTYEVNSLYPFKNMKNKKTYVRVLYKNKLLNMSLEHLNTDFEEVI